MGTANKPLWKCPRCRHRFVTKNLWHSCGHYKLADHFKGKPKILRETFNKLVLAAKKYGRVTVYAQKTRIVFQGRVRFGGAVVKQDWVEGRIWLKRRIEHPRLIRVESYGNLGYGLHFKLQNPNDIDKSLVELMDEAYAIGQQELQTNDTNFEPRKARKNTKFLQYRR